MTLTITETEIHFGEFRLKKTDFPHWLERHRIRVPNTLLLEQTGKILRDTRFEDPEHLEQFIRDVCKWGGYAGIGGKIIRNNTPDNLKESFLSACEEMDKETPDLYRAQECLGRLKGLRRTSFNSKHLRLLRPDLFPVLDAILAKHLGYTLNWKGCESFAKDCRQAADALTNAGIVPPEHLGTDHWRPADIESAIFAHIRSL